MWQLCQYSQKMPVTHTGITVVGMTSGHLGEGSNQMQGMLQYAKKVPLQDPGSHFPSSAEH